MYKSLKNCLFYKYTVRIYIYPQVSINVISISEIKFLNGHFTEEQV